MIFVVEVPQAGEPICWFAFDAEDLLNKVALEDALQPWEIYDQATPRELLSLVEVEPGSAEADQRFPALAKLAQEYGLDTVLYRADYVLQAGGYQPQLISLEQACEAALLARCEYPTGPLKEVRLFWSEEQAVLATEAKDDELFTAPGGWRALHALREQLLALDVVADN